MFSFDLPNPSFRFMPGKTYLLVSVDPLIIQVSIFEHPDRLALSSEAKGSKACTCAMRCCRNKVAYETSRFPDLLETCPNSPVK